MSHRSERNMGYTHTNKLVCERGNIKVLWNQEIHTERKVMEKRRDVIIKNKNGERATDRCGNTVGHECHATGSRKEKNYKFMSRDTTNVEH